MSTAFVVAVLAASAVFVLLDGWGRGGDARRVTEHLPTSSRRVPRHAATLMISLLAALALGPMLAIVAGTAVAVGRAWSRRRVEHRRRHDAVAALPDATELFVACLHAGRSPMQAIADVARLGPASLRPAFEAVDQLLHRGYGVADALDELARQCGPSALPFVAATSAALRDGQPLAPLLDRLTDEAMSTRRRSGEAAARRLPVRLSLPLVACTLPAFVLLSIAPAILGAIASLQLPRL